MRLFRAAIVISMLGLSLAHQLPSGRRMHFKRDNSSDSTDPMYQLSTDSDFHFELLRVLGMAPYEGSDIGEVLVAINQIIPGDFESFYNAFYGLATRVQNSANSIDASRYPVSARNTFFKASSYFRSADFFLHGNWSDTRINTLWDQQLSAFNSALALMPVPGERVVLNGAQTGSDFTIPLIFYPSSLPGKRPTVIMCNGYDGSQEELYHYFVKAVTERGMNAITYEGPGQPTVRREQNLGFIPNWEAVVTPVVDYALTRREVDPDSLGLLGFSFGGYLAPRAAAFEHRVAAVMAVDGEYVPGASTLAQFPPEFQAVFNGSNATAFNEDVAEILSYPSLPTSIRWAVQQGQWAFNAPTPYEWLKKLQEYTLEGIVKNITAPVLVVETENDMFFPGQGKLLADHLGGLATYYYFSNEEGAGEHCSVGAAGLQNQVVLDWFEGVVSSNCKQ